MSTSSYDVLSPAIHLATVADTGDDNEAVGVVRRVHDSVVAHANPVVVAAGELRAADRAWIPSQRVHSHSHALAHGSVKPAELPCRCRNESDLVVPGVYSRTSAHGTAVSRS